MALPINQNNDNSQSEKENKPKAPGLPVRPSKPVIPGKGLPVSTGLPVSPVKPVGSPKDDASFLPDYDEQQQTVAQRREFNLTTKGEITYDALSNDLTAENVLNDDYEERFRHLENGIVQTLDWAQETLNDRGMSKAVADAREFRGEKLRQMQHQIDKLLLRYYDSTPDLEIAQANRGIVSAFVINEILGLGPLEPLWDDSRITEIMVNGPNEVMVEIGGKIVQAKGAKFRDRDHLLDTVNRILQPLNKSLDNSHPEQNGRLYDGSRLHALHTAVMPSGPSVTIRRFPETVFSVQKLVDFKAMTAEMAAMVGWLIHSGCSTIIAGGTGTGKTSMLNALSGCIPLQDRIISIEDTLELRLHPSRHWVPTETRKASHGDGVGDMDIRGLVRASLRMRPDRIVVGEVRDGAAYDMLQAMNTGHEGSLTTVHANDPEATVTRIMNLVTQSKEMDSQQALMLLANSVDIFVNIARYEDGSRRISHISEIPSKLNPETKQLEPRILWEFVQTGTETYIDEKGRELERVVGHYEKREELSPEIIKRHRLNHKRMLTPLEVFQMSAQEGEIVEVDEETLIKEIEPVATEDPIEPIETVEIAETLPEVVEAVEELLEEIPTPEEVEEQLVESLEDVEPETEDNQFEIQENFEVEEEVFPEEAHNPIEPEAQVEEVKPSRKEEKQPYVDPRSAFAAALEMELTEEEKDEIRKDL